MAWRDSLQTNPQITCRDGEHQKWKPQWNVPQCAIPSRRRQAKIPKRNSIPVWTHNRNPPGAWLIPTKPRNSRRHSMYSSAKKHSTLVNNSTSFSVAGELDERTTEPCGERTNG